MCLCAQASVVESVLALPIQTWSKVRETDDKKEGDDAEECALCMEPYKPDDEVRQLKCKHYFHKECADQWLVVQQKSKNRSCPICQSNPID